MFVLLYAILFSLIILADVGVGRVLQRSILAVPFVLAALPLVFTTSGEQILILDLGLWRVTATSD
jgi:cobalt/nickel transport system permease protein